MQGVKKDDAYSATAQPRLPGEADEDRREPDIMRADKQQEVLGALEQHFNKGLRRADGRTVGLGL